ncbi:MAG TPA: hypothetical protein ENN02_03190 [Halothiobacillus sp.]|nr:hypothetical protein [Halothiobacillus sp.]
MPNEHLNCLDHMKPPTGEDSDTDQLRSLLSHFKGSNHACERAVAEWYYQQRWLTEQANADELQWLSALFDRLEMADYTNETGNPITTLLIQEGQMEEVLTIKRSTE